MFVNNINKMAKKSIKSIKQDLEIINKKEALDRFGLAPNMTTKNYNKWLRRHYKKIEKQYQKDQQEQKTKQAKSTISKMAQTIKGKKRTQRRINIRRGINNIDKQPASFTNVVESDLEFILQQLNV